MMRKAAEADVAAGHGVLTIDEDRFKSKNVRGHNTMKIRRYALFLSLGLSVVIAVTVQQAQATLGESAASIESDRNVLSAVQRAKTVRDSFTVQEIQSGSTIVKEYISPSGIVFGIAWNGLIHPDLTQLLGTYAGEYEEALQQTPRQPGRRRIQVRTNRVVVDKWGHMRNLQGRAYVPALIPSGVSVDEIR
jgi:hypothetical protein